MKKLLYWVLGERAGRTVVGAWNWLWGSAVESGGRSTIAIAEQSIADMTLMVGQLAQAVATQVASYERARKKYEEKAEELKSLNQQALIATKQGNHDAARIVMTKVIAVEQLLPQLETQVKQAEKFVTASKDKLNQERLKIEQYKTDMQNMKDLAEINSALESIAQINNEFDVDSAQNSFEAAKNAVQNRLGHNQAMAELSINPADQAMAQLEQGQVDDLITQRLALLSAAQEEQ